MIQRSLTHACSLMTTLLLSAGFAFAASPAAEKTKPNIIVVLVDDLGFADFGCYGSEVPTPNLDKLAANGLRFTQFYNTARCCPTRAALLTGLYSHQTGVGHMVEDRGQPGYIGHLNDQCVTIAEVLKPAGYFTCMAGKWHVGQSAGVIPSNRGFQRSINAPAGGFYYADGKRDEIFVDGKKLKSDSPDLPKNWYTTDLWTDFGIRFIDEARAAKQPFFLYLAHNAPHFPLQAPDEDIAKFRGKYKMGWDKLREERHAKQLKLGLLDSAWALSPRPDPVKAWDALTPERQDHFDHIMSIYAACISHLDTAIGRLVDSLEKHGDLNNTLIMVMSDNGANAESGPGGRLEGDHPGGPGSEVYLGQSWATLGNTPFRRYKHFAHEGGISSPLIVHWPAKITAKNEFRQQQGHVIDVMATCVDVAGATYPKEFAGKPILPMEGKSLLPAFEDKPLTREAIYWEHEGNAAIRMGDWKLVRMDRNGAWELYDLKKDRTELHDLSTSEPSRAKDMADRWDVWAKRTNVMPYPIEKKAAKKEAAAAKP